MILVGAWQMSTLFKGPISWTLLYLIEQTTDSFQLTNNVADGCVWIPYAHDKAALALSEPVAHGSHDTRPAARLQKNITLVSKK